MKRIPLTLYCGWLRARRDKLNARLMQVDRKLRKVRETLG